MTPDQRESSRTSTVKTPTSGKNYITSAEIIEMKRKVRKKSTVAEQHLHKVNHLVSPKKGKLSLHTCTTREREWKTW